MSPQTLPLSLPPYPFDIYRSDFRKNGNLRIVFLTFIIQFMLLKSPNHPTVGELTIDGRNNDVIWKGYNGYLK